MKIYIAILFICFSATGFSQTLTVKDLQLLTGNWKGSLTYIDYSSGKPYTMPVNAGIIQAMQANGFIVMLSYPDEPKANGNDTFFISQNGKLFNGAKIVKLHRLKDEGIIITTATNGQDGNDNKKAVLKHIYTITKNSFSNRKEVKFTGKKNWQLRNEYKFNR
jgi:hypothetical protein